MLRISDTRKRKIFRPFDNISSDIVAEILNCLKDDDIFKSCLFVSHRFTQLCEEKYKIRNPCNIDTIAKFSHAYVIVAMSREQILSALKKCRGTLLVHRVEEFIDIDFSRVKLAMSIEKNTTTFKVNCPNLQVSSYTPCNFPNARVLDLSLHPFGDTHVDLTQYQFPNVNKLKIRFGHIGQYVCYNKLKEKFFDHDLFMKNHPQLIECFLLFSVHSSRTIIVPSTLERFGICTNIISHVSHCHTLDLSVSNLKELIIWDYTSYTNKTTIGITSCPKILPKLTIMAPYSLDIDFEKIGQIDVLTLYGTTILNNTMDTANSERRLKKMTDILYKVSTKINCLYFVGFYHYGGPGIASLLMKPTVKSLKFYRCMLTDVQILGDGLTEISFLNQNLATYNYNIYFPDSVSTITCRMDHANWLKMWIKKDVQYLDSEKTLRLYGNFSEEQKKNWLVFQKPKTTFRGWQVVFVDEDFISEEVLL